MHITMEWLVGKVKDGTDGWKNVKVCSHVKQCALCKIVYSMEEHVFIVKIFHQTSSFVMVPRQFWRIFNRWQAAAKSAITCVVQKSELTGNVCNNKKGVVGRHRSACTQDNVAHVHELLLQSPRKSVTQCSQSLCIKRTSTHTIRGWDLSLYP
jgi:hypothetical protein